MIAIGDNAKAVHNGSVAIGSNAVSATNAVVTTNTIAGTTYNVVSGTENVGALSIGSETIKRQIKNVGAGEVSATSTDAINGSQLHGTNTAINTLNIKVDANKAAQDIVNDAQAQYNKENDAKNDAQDKAITAAKTEVAKGNGINVTERTGANGQSVYTVSLIDDNLVKYDDPSKTSVTFGGVGATAPVKLTNVQAGDISADSTDAINGSQLHETNTAVNNLNVKVDANKAAQDAYNAANDAKNAEQDRAIAAAKTEVKQGDGIAVSEGTGANGQSIYTVALDQKTKDTLAQVEKKADKDYVDSENSRQDSDIKAAKTEVAAGTNIASVTQTTGADGQSIYTVNAKGSTSDAGSDYVTVEGVDMGDNTTKYVLDLSDKSKAVLDDVKNKAYTADVDAKNALQDAAIDKNADDIAELDGIAVKYDSKDKTSVTLGGDGAAEPVALTNVKDGDISAESKDAINGSQLHTVVQEQAATDKAQDDAIRAAKTEVKQGDGIAVSEGAGANGQSIYTVALDQKTKDTLAEVDKKAYTADVDAKNALQDAAIKAAKSQVKAGSNIAGIVETKGADGQSIYTVNAKGSTSDAGSDYVTVEGVDMGDNTTKYVLDLSDKSKAVLDDVKNKAYTADVDAKNALQDAAIDKNADDIAELDGIAVKYDSKDKTSVTLGGDGAAEPVALTNVKDGDISAESKDAINGSQLHTVVQEQAATDKAQDDAIRAAKTEVKQGDGIAVSEGAGANGQSIYTVALDQKTKDTLAEVDKKAYTADVDAKNALQDAAIKAAKSQVKAGSNIAGIVETKGADGQSIYTVNAKGSTSDAGSDYVTVEGVDMGDNTTKYVLDLSDKSKAVLDDVANKADKTYVDREVKAAKTEVKAGTNIASVVETKGENGQSIYTVNAHNNTTEVGSEYLSLTNTAGPNNTTVQTVDLSDMTKAALAKIDGKADQTYVDSRFGDVNNRLDAHERRFGELDDKLEAQGASAMAVAGLLQSYRAGQSNASVAIGQNGSKQAIAFGVNALSDGGKWGVKATLAANTEKNVSGSVGVGWFW
ncbi:YadA-like family protein [Moraxella caviae]|uniref:YadA-like family protein n=1 Tax=Moraxella caviae TaxID=34060 RepID=UPI001F5F1BD5|nr:YadA-like family protein [Moraxella caviae]